MRFALCCVAAFGCGSTPSPAAPPIHAPSDPLVVTTSEGEIVGALAPSGVRSYLGVPFATPPVGDLRWREPLPPHAHPRLQTTAFHLPCSQIPIPEGSDSFGTGKKIQSAEDCLYLNVWVPPHAAGEKLPVMVWIHGGQYLRGAASQYDGEQLAQLGNVVVVTLDYRLGPLGFLAHPALTAESPGHTSGNAALFDALQALRWLGANVASFDGDPQRITLFGESAGSASTCALLASPLARGLFQRIILESDACPDIGDSEKLAEREKFGRRLAEALGCTNADLAAELACMRGKSADEVMTAIPLAKVFGDDGKGVHYVFDFDDVMLRESPEDALKAGRIAHVDVMLGTTDNEMGRYIGGYGVKTIDDYKKLLAKEFPKDAKDVLAMYPVKTDADLKPQLSALMSDWAMTCPTHRDAQWFAKAGNRVWLYRFTHAPDVFGGRSNGAFHGSELVYLFPSVFTPHGLHYDDDDKKLAAVMSGYWARFAATGDPNGGGAPAWPRYALDTEPYVTLDVDGHPGTQLKSAECKLWDRD